MLRAWYQLTNYLAVFAELLFTEQMKKAGSDQSKLFNRMATMAIGAITMIKNLHHLRNPTLSEPLET